MEKLIVLALLLMTMIPLVIAAKRSKNGKSGKAALITNICMFFALGIGIIIALPLTAAAAETTETAVAAAGNLSVGTGMAYIAAALSTGLACLGAGVAVEKAYQHGGDIIRSMGVRVESLARISGMSEKEGVRFLD